MKVSKCLSCVAVSALSLFGAYAEVCMPVAPSEGPGGCEKRPEVAMWGR